ADLPGSGLLAVTEDEQPFHHGFHRLDDIFGDDVLALTLAVHAPFGEDELGTFAHHRRPRRDRVDSDAGAVELGAQRVGHLVQRSWTLSLSAAWRASPIVREL